MKREEKNRQSREKILEAAVKEFGAKSYDGASLNCAVSSSRISKGLVYHYFENKDELYLSCVKECFDKLTTLIREAKCEESVSFSETAQRYFDIRNVFFVQNPDLCSIFFEAVMQPPVHLKVEIAGLKKEFTDMNLHLIHSGLDKLQLREGISIQEAIEYYLTVAEAFNYDFYKRWDKNAGTDALMKKHEQKLQKTLDILLFGLVKSQINNNRGNNI